MCVRAREWVLVCPRMRIHDHVRIYAVSLYNTLILAVSMRDSQNETTNYTQGQASVLLSVVAYLHIILIIIPTVVLGILIIVAIWKEKKPSGRSPIIIIYLAMALFSLAAVLSYGFLWDISLITDIAFLGECGTSIPMYSIYNFLYFGFHSIIALNVGVAAVFQFLMLKYGRKVSSKWVYLALLSLIIASIVMSCIFFNGLKSTTIKASYCRHANALDGVINVAAWLPLAFTVPLVLTIVFSVLTCCKVKKSAIQPLNDEKSLVISIVKINIFNILLYLTVRLVSVLLFFFGTRLLHGNQDAVVAIIILSKHLNDASYPSTLTSILVVHKGIRRMAAKLLCGKLLGERETHATSDEVQLR